MVAIERSDRRQSGGCDGACERLVGGGAEIARRAAGGVVWCDAE